MCRAVRPSCAARTQVSRAACGRVTRGVRSVLQCHCNHRAAHLDRRNRPSVPRAASAASAIVEPLPGAVREVHVRGIVLVNVVVPVPLLHHHARRLRRQDLVLPRGFSLV